MELCLQYVEKYLMQCDEITPLVQQVQELDSAIHHGFTCRVEGCHMERLMSTICTCQVSVQKTFTVDKCIISAINLNSSYNQLTHNYNN